MQLLSSIKKGTLNVFRGIWMWLFLYGVQLIFALLLIRPLTVQFKSMTEFSLFGRDLLSGNGIQFFNEFFAHRAETYTLVTGLLLVAGLLYLLLSLFFQGGVLAFFSGKDKFKLHTFIAESAAFYGRFLRLFFFTLPWILLLIIIHMALDPLFKMIAGDSEMLIFTLTVGRIALLLIGLNFLNMVFDYAKIHSVIQNPKKMIKTWLASLGFAFRQLGKTMFLYYAFFLVSLILFALFLAIQKMIPISSGVGLLLFILWNQIFALLRTGLRLDLLASETALYQSIISRT